MSQFHWILLTAFSLFGVAVAPQNTRPADLGPLVREVAQYQLAMIQHSGAPLQYELHRTDTKEDTTRVMLDSQEGPIGRLIARDGRALTQVEDAAEKERLRTLTSSDTERKKRGKDSGEKFGAELVSAMPAAMIYSLTPGQPQLPQLASSQIVLDYRPDPAFHPASSVQALLTGLQGRLWVDASDHHLLRMEIHVTHNLNLAWGLLARVYTGGTLDYDQRKVGEGQYAYTRIAIDLTLRELMVKTVPYRSLLVATNYKALSTMPSRADAVRRLLSLNVPSAPAQTR